MEWWHGLVEAVLPFDWAQFDFMKNALLAVILIAPVFGLLGTMVIQSRLTFFSDVLGHSALTGIAIGVVLGLGDPLWAMLIFAVILAVGINLIMRVTSAGPRCGDRRVLRYHGSAGGGLAFAGRAIQQIHQLPHRRYSGGQPRANPAAGDYAGGGDSLLDCGGQCAGVGQHQPGAGKLAG